MADTKHSKDEEHEGASLAEQVIEACRRDNTELLKQIIDELPSPEAVAKLLNEARTPLGNYAYHEAALRGNYDIIDLLLDQEGFECDPINLREGDSPLHSIVRWINEQPKENHEYGASVVEMMLEAGNDPRIRNKAKLLPSQLVDPRNTALKEIFQKAEYVKMNEGDFVDLDDQGADEDGAGSASDSE